MTAKSSHRAIGEKLPENLYTDLSDYGRPLARLITKVLMSTPVTPVHVTWLFTVVGLCAAGLIWSGKLLWLAALLLPLKSVLDAVDGQLARARERPSYVGRYLDADNDFLVNFFVFLALAHLAELSPGLGLLALLLATFQGTIFHYYQVTLRHTVDGERTSRVDERRAPNPYPWDNPRVLRFLHRVYLFIYGWQEQILRRVDPVEGIRLPSAFLTTASWLGLGSQLLVISLFLLLSKPSWALWYFVGPASGLALTLIVYRRRSLAHR